MRLKLLLIPLVAVAGVLGVTSYAGATNGPQTRIINAGGGSGGIDANDFFPNEITIQKGDTIRFNNPYEEPHTTTYVPGVPEFGPPPPLLIGPNFNPLALDPTNTSGGVTDFDPHKYYNSGFMFKGATADVIFNVTGTFKFLCLFHPGMEETVTVVGTPITIASQDAIDKVGNAQRDALITAGKALASAATLTKVTDASGASTWDVIPGLTQGKSDVMQFLPAGPTKISTGDTVRWTSITEVPHTITFGNGPDILNAAGTGFGPGVAPSGGSTYSGGDANSGVIDNTGTAPGGTSYSLTFTKAGTYTYVCLLHADQGMAGTIIVSDKAPVVVAPPIKPPNTGTGGVAGGGGSWLGAMLLLGVTGVALTAAGARVRIAREV
jgi:plastocyanin